MAFKMIGKMIRQWRPAYRVINRLRRVRLHEPNMARAAHVLGTEYGGWGVDLNALSSGAVVYSVGVGEDTSFDEELIDRLGCRVFAFDPTPKAVAWVERQNLPTSFKFTPVGIAARDGELEFEAPRTSGGASYSMAGQNGENPKGPVLRCPVRRLCSLMAQFDHTALDVLKMDVEGAEYEVLDDMISCGIRPRFLLVEFHHGLYEIPTSRTLATVQKLKDYDYGIYWISDIGREYGFCDLGRVN